MISKFLLGEDGEADDIGGVEETNTKLTGEIAALNREIDTVKAQMGTKMEAEKTIKSVMDDTLGQASI
eukprot:PRCOL_00004870-RA